MLIHREHTISIAIKGRTEVSAYLAYLPLQIFHILRLDGTGRMIGKTAIQVKVKRDKFAGQVLEHTRHHHARHAIASVDYHLEWPDFAYVNERKGVLNVIIKYISMYHLSFVHR